MVQIRNMGANAFINYIQDKKVYFFGAGKITENCIDIYCQNKKVEAILDNNKNLWNKEKRFANQEVKIISVESFVKSISKKDLNNIVLVIAPNIYASKMINQLDSFSELEGLNCYVHAFIRNTRESVTDFDFTKGEIKIPKIIHYFWVGGNPLPGQFQKFIDSWKFYNPEYEIIRWDEKNYDFSKNQYMKEAYESKAWGFVPDYARLDVIYQYGGVYLDTDVEAIRGFDPLLCDDAFFGMGCADRINIGVGFGAVPGNILIKELRDYYNDKHFCNSDGSKNRVACYYYQHPIFKRYGFQIKSEYQKIDNMVVYPPEVLSAKGTDGFGDFFSEKTLSIHHGSGTWITAQEQKEMQELEKMFKQRLKN